MAIVATTGTAGGAAGLLATTGVIVLVVVAVTVQAGGLLRPAEVLVDAVGEGGCCFFLTACEIFWEYILVAVVRG